MKSDIPGEAKFLLFALWAFIVGISLVFYNKGDTVGAFYWLIFARIVFN